MAGKRSNKLHAASLVRVITVLAMLTLMVVGCIPGIRQAESHPCAISLLLVDPIFRSDDDRKPIPEGPARYTIREETVEGYSLPPNGVLGFPVDLRGNTRLSFRWAAITPHPVYFGDLEIRVEFVPEQADPEDEPPEAILLHEDFPQQVPLCVDNWIDVVIGFDDIEASSGELRFVTESSIPGDPGINVLVGQPVVYYPDEMRNMNVLLIGVDTLRQDALAIYGGRSEVSPNITRYSETAVIFDNAWSQAPFTGPSFASMVTGQYPSRISATFTTVQVPDPATTISEILIREGFATGMICGNPYLGAERSGFSQGVESVWYRLHATPTDSVEEAKKFIDRSQDRDWFLFFHLMDPHNPYDPPEEYIDSLCDPDYHGFYQTEFADMYEWNYVTQNPPEQEINRARELYDAETADVDNSIGQLLRHLEETGQMENTLIILAADHGEEFFEHGQYGHGQTLLDELVHLPLVVWGDGFEGSQRVETTVANYDIVPTILSFLEIPPTGEYPGMPLQEIVSGTFGENRPIYGEGNLRRGNHRKFSVEWPYKCIVDYFTGQAWVYDLENDPFEMTNIFEENMELAQRISIDATHEMLPLQTTFLVTIIGSPVDGPERFTGTVHVPGGVGHVTVSGPMEGDDYSFEGENITFDLSSITRFDNPKKALIIYPMPGGDVIELSVRMDGEIDPTRFCPNGNDVPEPSCTAIIDIYDLPWPNRIPTDAIERPVAMYVLGIPGYPDEDNPIEYEHVELDPEIREQLHALGYIN